MAGTRHGSSLAYQYISLARYKHAEQFGSMDDQIHALREMLLSNDRGQAVLNGALADKELLRLLIESKYYGEALELYHNIVRKQRGRFKPEVDAAYGEAIEKISDLLTSEQGFSREIRIKENGYTFVPMIKRKVQFDRIRGVLNQLVVRCKRKYATFKIVAARQFEIPKTWGQCQLQILGAPNSKAQLVQS